MAEEKQYTGEERRTDSVSVRLALLERSYFENKESQVAIHKRITEIKKGVADEIRMGLDALFLKLDKTDENCGIHNARTTTLENNVKWIDRWLMALSAAVASVTGWNFYNGGAE